MAKPRQAIANREDLVDLLLILGDDDAGLGMIEHRGDLLGDRIGVDGDRNRADHLRRRDRPVELRPVGADDGEGVAAVEAEDDEAARDGAGLVIDLSPGPRLPEAEILMAVGGAGAAHSRMRPQELGERVVRVSSLGRRLQAVLPPLRRSAREPA